MIARRFGSSGGENSSKAGGDLTASTSSSSPSTFRSVRLPFGGYQVRNVIHALPVFTDPDGFHDNIVRGARIKFNDSSRLKLRRRAYIQWDTGHPSKVLIVKKTKNAAASRQLKTMGDWLVAQGLQVYVEKTVHANEFPEFHAFEPPVMDDPESVTSLASYSDDASPSVAVPRSWHGLSPPNSYRSGAHHSVLPERPTRASHQSLGFLPSGRGWETTDYDEHSWRGTGGSSGSLTDSSGGSGSGTPAAAAAPPPAVQSAIQTHVQAAAAKLRGTDVDFCITLGGDGTVLHLASLFERDEPLPPVISFAMGSLGFLTPFDVSEFKMRLTRVLSAVQGSGGGPLFCTLRTRKRCEVHHGGRLQCVHNVLNEMVLDRGASPSVVVMELFIDGNHVTTVEADGLIIASPSGSTAYSLSAGGPIIAPSVPCTILTPIAPLSLSFRPLVVPESSSILIHLPDTMRSHARASFDGKRPMRVRRDSYIMVSTSLCPLPVINVGAMDSDWYDGVNKKLKWNQAMRQPPKMLHSAIESVEHPEWFPDDPVVLSSKDGGPC